MPKNEPTPLSLRLKEIRERRGVTQEHVAENLNIEIGTLSGYERAYRKPSPEMLSGLADFYACSVDYLLGRTDDPINYDDFDLIAELQGPVLDHFDGDVKKALEFKRTVEEDALKEADQKALDKALKAISDHVRLPIIGMIRAGMPILAQENIIGYEDVSASWLNGGDHFLLRVTGDSMTGARIFPGDTVLIRMQDDCENGEICAVLINDEATLKRVYQINGKIELVPENPLLSRTVFDRDLVRIIGKVKKVMFDPK